MKTKKVYPPKKIWDKFRRQRLKLEMTQEQLADRLEISQSHVQRHERYARALKLVVEIEPAKIKVITDDEHKKNHEALTRLEEANLPEEIV